MAPATHNTKHLSEEALQLDSALASVADRLDMSLINPINAATIKRSYRPGDNPRFLFAARPQHDRERKTLTTLSFPKTVCGTILKEKQQDLLIKTKLIEAIGTRTFGTISKQLYAPPDARLVRYAEDLLTERPVMKGGKVRLQDAYKEMQRTLDQLKLPWHVQKMNMIAGASVMPSQQTLYLKRKELFSRRFIDRLKVHEIGTHAIRAENGRLQPLKVFLYGLGGYLPTEEGLAVWNEEQFGLLDSTVIRTYAGRVIAVAEAMRGDFSAVVDRLQPHFPRAKAVQLALRAKRGLASGAEKGAHTKDTAYLQGYTLLRSFVEKGGDLRALYVGKIGLHHLKMLKDEEWVQPPKYHPEMLKL